MSAQDVINAWNADPTVKTPTERANKPVEPATAPQKSMSELIAEKGGQVPSAGQPSAPQQSKAQEIEALWQNDVGRSDLEKAIEVKNPEEFKQEFMNRMMSMDIGERTAIERILFGKTAEDANRAQAFLRGIRGELAETGIGVSQRIGDVMGSDEETELENERMRQQVERQTDTNFPATTKTGEITGTVAQFIPLAATGAGIVPLLAEGAAYGLTRPQEKGYTGLDVLATTGGEALLSLIGGKATQKFVDLAGPVVKNAYSKITGKAPKGSLIDENGVPSDELLEALRSQGLEYEDLLTGSGVLDEMKRLLRASPAAVDPEQAVRAARYEALGIDPVRSSVTGSFDEAVDAQTLRRQINDPEAGALRESLATESEGFKEALNRLAQETGDPDIDGVGTVIRDALIKRRDEQRLLKNKAYQTLAQAAKETGETISIPKDGILNAWRETKGIKRSQMSALHSDVKESLMKYGLIEPDSSFKKLVEAGDESITPLDVSNFESFRAELNANINPQDPATTAIIRPILEQLDGSVDDAAAKFEGAKVLTNLSKEARRRAREFAQEFNSADTVSDILKTKKGTFDTYQIRGQDLFRKLIKTSRKTPTNEQLDEVLTSLRKAGPKGEKAIADLQSATILNLLDEATSNVSAKGLKGRQFSYTNYIKALDGIGEKELDTLFQGNEATKNMLIELRKAAQDSQTFSDAIPKGSANDMQNMFIRGFGPLFETMGFAKAGTIGRLAAQSLMEKGSERASKSQLRKAVAKEIQANPQIREEMVRVSKQFPGLFEAIGISTLEKSIRNEEE